MNLSASLTLEQTAAYLRTLPAVRSRCGQVFELAKQGKLKYFTYHPEKESDVIKYCLNIITRDFGSNFEKIPPHGRWRHFDAGIDRVEPMISYWSTLPNPPDVKETCKRLLDLFVVSVLLDAGAGKDWMYTESSTGASLGRSEGLAVASINMFKSGLFSSDSDQPYQVDATALSELVVETVATGLQVSSENPVVGLEGRTSLLQNLGKALKASPDLFKKGRPGDMLDFLESQSLEKDGIRLVPLEALWHVLIDGFNPVWPTSRTKLAGVPLGDVWPCPTLDTPFGKESDNLVPFHKLTQWMTYSLIEVIVKILNWKIVGIEDMTGLPEYRNGGLLMDLGLLELKPGALSINPVTSLPQGAATHPAIVEWRAMTVIILDQIADGIRLKLGLTAEQLSLAQVLESATWKGGREIAKEKRPATGGPPIELESDGTIF